jgi:hypothetical protein
VTPRHGRGLSGGQGFGLLDELTAFEVGAGPYLGRADTKISRVSVGARRLLVRESSGTSGVYAELHRDGSAAVGFPLRPPMERVNSQDEDDLQYGAIVNTCGSRLSAEAELPLAVGGED